MICEAITLWLIVTWAPPPRRSRQGKEAELIREPSTNPTPDPRDRRFKGKGETTNFTVFIEDGQLSIHARNSIIEMGPSGAFR